MFENKNKDKKVSDEKSNNNTSTNNEEKDNDKVRCVNCKELEKEVEILNQKLKRVLADYQNLKRRTAEEKTELSFYSNLAMLGNMLEVSDDFDLAIEKYTKTEADEADWLTGIKMVRDKMGKVLEDQQVTEIVCQIDDEFNPEYHEAVSSIKVEEKDMDGIIIGIVRKGYLLGDRVLRPTRVVVGSYEDSNK